MMNHEDISRDVASILLQWTANDIANKIPILPLRSLPKRYSHDQQWFTQFFPNLLEEQRANLHKLLSGDLDSLDHRQCMISSDDRLGDILEIPLTKPEEVENWDKELSLTLALLVKSPRSKLSLSSLAGHTHALVLFDRQFRKDAETDHLMEEALIPRGHMPFRVQLPRAIEGDKWHVYLLKVPVIPIARVWEALWCALGNSHIMPVILSAQPSVHHVTLCAPSVVSALEEEVRELNAEQRDAVLSYFNHATCRPLSIIKGPPGTGKTRTLAALLNSFLKVGGIRTHAAAPTNQAIAELARKTLRFAGEVESSTVLSRMLLVGNLDKAPLTDKKEFDDPLVQLHMSLRSKRIAQLPNTLDLLKQFLILASKEPAAALPGLRKVSGEDMCKLLLLLSLQLRETPAVCYSCGYEEVGFVLELLQQLIGICTAWKAKRNLSSVIKEVSWQQALDIMTQLPVPLSRLRVDTFEPKILQKILVKNAMLVFSTVNYGYSNWLREESFQVALVDEASQLLECDTSILIKPELQCLILVGDNKQLPPTVLSDANQGVGFGQSLLERLMEHGYPHHLLRVQYRMHPQISSWPNSRFYENRLVDGSNVVHHTYNNHLSELSLPPFVLCNITGSKEMKTEGGSWYNELESQHVGRLLSMIQAKRSSPLSVGIISPYNGQVDTLRNLESRSTEGFDVRVSTVDGFQGQECDIIIFSAVRSNPNHQIGFLRDERRLNVAATRAKHAFVVICNAETLSRNPVWRSMFKHAARCSSTTEVSALIKEMRPEKFVLRRCSHLFEDLPWKIEFSADFQNAMQNVPDDKRLLVLRKLAKLGGGEWPNSKLANKNVIPDHLVGMVHIAFVHSFRIVWSVDIKRSTGKQFILVQTICAEKSISVGLKNTLSRLTQYSQTYVDACSKKNATHKVFLPQTVDVSSIVWLQNSDNAKRHRDRGIGGEKAGGVRASCEEKKTPRRLRRGKTTKHAAETRK